MSGDSVKTQSLFPRGGARRKSGGFSDSLSEHQCRLLLAASDRASAANAPLNRFITILWERGGIAEREAAKATQLFLKLAGDWFRSRGERFCWVYVHEWGVRNGAHAHILLHVPRHLDKEFGRLPLKWVKRLLPTGYRQGALKSLKLLGGNAPDGISAQIYAESLMYRLHYMMKAANPALEAKLKLVGASHAVWGQSSPIYGKRAGCWQAKKPSTDDGGCSNLASRAAGWILMQAQDQ